MNGSDSFYNRNFQNKENIRLLFHYEIQTAHTVFLILHLNNLYPLLLAKFQAKIFQSEFLNLATARHREFIHKEE